MRFLALVFISWLPHRKLRILEPANKLILFPGALGKTDLFALRVLEAHCYAVGAPIQRGIYISVVIHRIGVHQHTVFLLDPLGIDTHAILRHSGEGARRRTDVVQVPSCKYEAFHRIGFIVIRAVRRIILPLVVGRHVRIVGDLAYCFQSISSYNMIDRDILIGHIGAVEISKGIGIASVIAFDCACATTAPSIGRRFNTKLSETGDRNIIFCFSKPVIVTFKMFIFYERLVVICDCYAGFTRKRFDVIVYILICAWTIIIFTEGYIRIGHNIDIAKHLIIRCTTLRIPTRSCVSYTVRANDREMVRDGLTIKGSNLLYSMPAVLA